MYYIVFLLFIDCICFMKKHRSPSKVHLIQLTVADTYYMQNIVPASEDKESILSASRNLLCNNSRNLLWQMPLPFSFMKPSQLPQPNEMVSYSVLFSVYSSISSNSYSVCLDACCVSLILIRFLRNRN